MEILYLDFEMLKEETKTHDLIATLNNLDMCEVIIYIDCVGGENRIAAILYDYLKRKNHNYKFIINGSCSSNMFLILAALNPEYIKFMRQGFCKIHLSNYNHPISTIVLNDRNDIDLYDLKDFTSYLEDMFDLYKEFLSKKELKLIKKGEEIYLCSKRSSEIFKKIKNNKDLQEKAKKIFEITL